MNSHLRLIAIFCLAYFICQLSFPIENDSEFGESEGMEIGESNLDTRFNRMLADPHTGRIPDHMRMRELEFAKSLPVVGKGYYKANNMGFWNRRGPFNVGGRTRAIVVDRSNPSTLVAGAASGGIWKSENGGQKWWMVSRADSFSCVTSIIQDPRKGKEKIWYAGTGEYFGGYVPGQYYTGSGIQKSIDGGNSWHALKSTQSNNVTFDIMFDFVHRLAINPAIDSIDVVFAATYGCIFRSLNGGLTWQTRKGSSTSPSTWTDIAISSKGVIYATLSGQGSGAGIWRSTDNGQTWGNITPPWFTSTCGRIIPAIAPSDENQIYFVAYTPDTGRVSHRFDGKTERNSFWKYTYKSGDGSGSGGQWEDRSDNLPSFGGAFGDYISQQGYSMSLIVKPDNPDVVVLGGSSLYRSDDGFKTNLHTSWIGGYKPNTTLPDFKTYANHHPDQHGLVFYPGSTTKLISTHDGGISLTQDVTATDVKWESLNNGYHTVQFYGTAIDKQGTNNAIAGGLQDNGTLFTSSSDNLKPWNLTLSYDGGFCFLGKDASEAYMSVQSGRIYRMLIDNNGVASQSARIDPKDALRDDYEFINPYTPAIDDYYKIFNPCGQLIWRNKDIRQIPLHAQLDSTPVNTGWLALESTRINDAADAITAITSAPYDVVYYGTSKGKLFKMENASSDTPKVSSIRQSNLPTGYINCITVDPDNSSKIFIIYANYGILSIFSSDDQGQNWQAISGNLEDNTSGSGNGPSCRWFTCAKIQGQKFYYVGTSIGLFACDSLKGMNTTWVRQSPDAIGVNIVTMMQFRESDAMMAVSTFGAGMFNAILNSTKDQSSLSETMYTPSINLWPIPASNRLHFSSSILPANISIMNMQGQIVLKHIEKDQIEINIESLPAGQYIFKAESSKAILTKRFQIE